MKNRMFIISLIFIIITCVFCIISLNKNENASNTINYEELKKDEYVVYKKIKVSRNNLKKTKEIDGMIVKEGDLYKELKIIGKKDGIKIEQGKTVRKGQLLYSDGSVEKFSDINGVIDNIKVDKNTCFIKIADYDDRYIEANIPIEYLKYIKLKDNIYFKYGTKRYKGVIGYVSSIAENNAAKIKINFKDKKCNLLTYAEVKVEIEESVVKDAISVPKEALIRSGNEVYVKVDNGTEEGELQKVELGIESDDGEMEIKSGLNQDDVIMVDLNEMQNKEED